MPVEWGLDEFSDSEKVILIDGNIEGMGLINNYNNLKACLKIIINDDHINITNKEQLKELLDKADRIKDLDQYTIESKERFLEALMQAKIIYNDESSSQIMIDKARAVLNEAINSLEKKVIIKDNLGRLISEVEGLNGLDYTDVSWEFLSEVLKKAKIIFNQIDCSQEEIDNCCIELEDAINRLVKKKVDIIVSKNPNSVNTGDSNIEKEYFALLAISCLGIIIKKRKD
ncbi:FIVAR domain-containing protein [Thomasclavelia cocleata]|nr:FIVAR domain-containing protein [Thomasclavelia cocleata]